LFQLLRAISGFASGSQRSPRPPSPFPTQPTWLLSQKNCKFAAQNNFAKCGEVETNWLGTDDGGRGVVARLIYGFRFSVRAKTICLSRASHRWLRSQFRDRSQNLLERLP